jgi:hypothetical protein
VVILHNHLCKALRAVQLIIKKTYNGFYNCAKYIKLL